MDDIQRMLSVRLYDVMDKIGASEKIRKLYQDMAITNEIIHTILRQIYCISAYMFGSSCEGTTTMGLASDVDVLLCHEVFPVIDDINTAPPGISFFMVRDNNTNPGYVKLQLVFGGYPLYDKDFPYISATDNAGRVCLKHLLNMNMPNIERHGPAYSSPEKEGNQTTDLVIAYRCKTIPHFVRKWLFRHRPNSWPSHDDLQTMSGLGCFVVRVGHCSSPEFDIEWRLSFSLQERLLMFSFNPTQHKCYILLKMFKKEVIQQRIGESISSYHCKTCMFYAIENTKANLWKPHKLLTCLRVCLMILLTWVYNGYCPNYFIPSENMFDRPRYRTIKDNLVKVLRELVLECPSTILHLQCDCVGQMIGDLTIHTQNNGLFKLLYWRYLISARSVLEISNININSICFKNPRNACQQLSYQIKSIKTTGRITEHTEQQISDAISFAIPVLHLQLAQRMVSLAFTSEGRIYRQTILQLSLHHFREGRSHGLFTAKLLISSLLMRMQYYDLCKELLESIADSLKPFVISQCMCCGKPIVLNTNLIELLKKENISSKMFRESCVLTCIRFLPCDAEITPIPLRAEMFRSDDTIPGSRDYVNNYWFDWAVVDGKVYLFFQQYLVYSKLNMAANKLVAIDNLIWILSDDPNLNHKETGYNLLGWIYVQEGRQQEAIRCFMTSWRIRPHHNAAKFHIRKLANDMMQL